MVAVHVEEAQVKVVILAGGFGTRILEESLLRPKPLIEIGGYPILWHIMKSYSHCGFNEFIICCGYRGNMIKEYFANYYLYHSDVTFDFSRGGAIATHKNTAEPWKVTVVDTGLHTQTGGRLARVQRYLENETFMLTYGDGVADIDINALLEQHKRSNMAVTVTGVQLEGRFGLLDVDETGTTVTGFVEKPRGSNGWINGGFMVMDPGVFKYLRGDSSVLEQDLLTQACQESTLGMYAHHGFWQCMDTQRNHQYLVELWEAGQAPWKVWG